jgi:hypothetical protein
MFQKKKYLVHLDILGFGPLLEIIADDMRLESGEVRAKFKITIQQKIEEAQEKFQFKIIDSGIDDWTLSIDNIQNTFFVISHILDHYTGYKDYKTVPLEIAVGVVDYSKWVNENELIYQNKTIDYLKFNIIKGYHKWYKKKYNKYIEDTYIIITESFFKELSIFDQNNCEPIPYKGNYFYYLPNSIIKRERQITKFLKEIRQKKSDFSGALIDRVFVPPKKYDKIKDTLKRDRIVFITGTAGYGKTYTAIRLLWEYFNKKYIPRWITGKDELERSNVRDELANIASHLEPGHVIYFEDPFGKTKYERRDDLKEKINHIINTVKNNEDVYVIITSRKDVFEEFEKESYSVEQINKFEQELNILRPVYNTEKRREMLEKWATEKDCKWLNYEKLKEFVFKSIEIKNNLQTPLSIYDFVESTINIIDLDEIKKNISEYSKIPAEAFADEIKGLYDSGHIDRIIFLSLVFILEPIIVDFVHKQYDKIKKDYYEEFEDILEKEYRVKNVGGFDESIFDSEYFYTESHLVKKAGNFDKSIFDTESYLAFAHPSYSESAKYAIKHSGFKNIFSEVLIQLSHINIETIISSVSWAVVTYYNDLPKKAKNLIFQFSELPNIEEYDIAISETADAIMYNYENVPYEVKKLLFKLAREADWSVEHCKYLYKVPKGDEESFKESMGL